MTEKKYTEIEDLLRSAKPADLGVGVFAIPQESWPQVNEIAEEKLLTDLFSKKIIHFNFFSRGIKKRGRTIRIPFFMQFRKSLNQRSQKLRGCNMSFWKEDFIKINGFNESLVGWGIDDSEMIQRLHNIGINGKRLKFAGIAYHIYHKEQSKSHLEINNEIEKQTTEKKLTFIEKGINQYL